MAAPVPSATRPLADLFSLRARVALVTGAGGGLGRIFAQVLAEAGATVIVADVRPVDAAETVELVRASGGSAQAVEVDVADAESIDRMATAVRERHGRLHVLVNNAGISTPPGRVHEIPVATWDGVCAVNLRGTFLCSRALLPLMLETGAGSIINIASIAGLQGLDPAVISQAGYVATKAGVIGLTLQMAVDYAADGIRVNAIAPGWHLGTKLGERVGNYPTPEARRRRVEQVIARTPMRRTGEPHELRGLLLYLATDASSFVTGQVVAHDGGWTVW
jgi:NAD(P)-dependent dehydrogenase (short-subunit alcohol dehydrogenase family)